jgi:hypothetical protein
VKGMFETLEPLHAMIHRGPQTLKETSFNQVSSVNNTKYVENKDCYNNLLTWSLIFRHMAENFKKPRNGAADTKCQEMSGISIRRGTCTITCSDESPVSYLNSQVWSCTTCPPNCCCVMTWSWLCLVPTRRLNLLHALLSSRLRCKSSPLSRDLAN